PNGGSSCHHAAWGARYASKGEKTSRLRRPAARPDLASDPGPSAAKKPRGPALGAEPSGREAGPSEAAPLAPLPVPGLIAPLVPPGLGQPPAAVGLAGLA